MPDAVGDMRERYENEGVKAPSYLKMIFPFLSWTLVFFVLRSDETLLRTLDDYRVLTLSYVPLPAVVLFSPRGLTFFSAGLEKIFHDSMILSFVWYLVFYLFSFLRFLSFLDSLLQLVSRYLFLLTNASNSETRLPNLRCSMTRTFYVSFLSFLSIFLSSVVICPHPNQNPCLPHHEVIVLLCTIFEVLSVCSRLSIDPGRNNPVACHKRSVPSPPNLLL